MRKLYKRIRWVLFIVLITSLQSCQRNGAGTPDEGNITVSDFRNKEVTLKKPAERVVCLIESALSGIYMLQAADVIIAVSANVYQSNVLPYYALLDDRIQSRTLPAPGNWDFINLERIVSLNPDLVIIWASQTEAIQNIESLGIPVYGVMLQSMDDIYKEIRDFGKLLNREDRAGEIIQFTAANLNSIKNKRQNTDKKSVYFMWAQGITETSGTNSTVNELIEAAGARNVCTMEEEHVIVNIERIIEWNPDIILMWYNERMDPEDVINNPLLNNVRAVQEKHVFEIPSVFLFDMWTLKMQFTAEYLASICDGTNEDFFLQQKHPEGYIRLYGTDLFISDDAADE